MCPLAMSGEILGCHNCIHVYSRVATGIHQVEARDDVKHYTMHRTVPAVKNDLSQNVDSAEVEKACTTCVITNLRASFIKQCEKI